MPLMVSHGTFPPVSPTCKMQTSETTIMHRSWRLSVLISSACLAMTFPAAASVDVLSFVQKELLHCIHPTIKVDKAKVEIDKPTITDGDTSTTSPTFLLMDRD